MKYHWKTKLFQNFYPPFSKFVQEETSHYHPIYKRIKGTVFLQGYWQNPRYFESIHQSLRKYFTFQGPLSSSTLKFEKEINNIKESVAVHIRRKDYLLDPLNQEICSLSYYQNAMNRMKESKPNAHFYIFSDDRTWARENLKSNWPITYVNRALTKEQNFEDMYLMSKCNNHIIANSSFSWWGAFLGENPEQLVIAPKKWDSIRKATDIVLPDWELL